MLQQLDMHWREHLAGMDYLRQGIYLRAYAQKNPKQEYKREAFELFTGDARPHPLRHGDAAAAPAGPHRGGDRARGGRAPAPPAEPHAAAARRAAGTRGPGAGRRRGGCPAGERVAAEAAGRARRRRPSSAASARSAATSPVPAARAASSSIATGHCSAPAARLPRSRLRARPRMGDPAEIHVVAGAIADAEGRVLIAQRPRGRHMAGRWEFPGGKLGCRRGPLHGSPARARRGARRRRCARRARSFACGTSTRTGACCSTSGRSPTTTASRRRSSRRRSPGRGPTTCRSTTCSRPTARSSRRCGCRGLRACSRAGESLQSIRGSAAQTILVPDARRTAPRASTREAVAAARAAGPPHLRHGRRTSMPCASPRWPRCDGVVLRWHRAEPARGPQRRVPRRRALRGRRGRDPGGRRRRALPGDRARRRRRCPSACSSGSASCVGRPVFAGWYPDARRLERLQPLGAHGCAVRR